MFQNTVMSIKFYFSHPFCSSVGLVLSLSSSPVWQVQRVHYVFVSSTAPPGRLADKGTQATYQRQIK